VANHERHLLDRDAVRRDDEIALVLGLIVINDDDPGLRPAPLPPG
jgi:hypothetical protein